MTTCLVVLEHLHPWAERQALEMRFEGLQACIKFFRVALPHRYLHIGSLTMNILENCQEYYMIPKSGTIH